MSIENPVTFAKPEDLSQIIAYAFRTYKDVGLEEGSPSLVKISTTLTDAIVNEIVLVERNEEDPKMLNGVIVMKHVSPWWSEDIMLKQLFFYTNPELRTSKTFTNLLDAVAEYGKIDTSIKIGQTIVGEDHARKGKLLTRKGYKKVGESYLLGE